MRLENQEGGFQQQVDKNGGVNISDTKKWERNYFGGFSEEHVGLGHSNSEMDIA